jgi:hypothetical protein
VFATAFVRGLAAETLNTLNTMVAAGELAILETIDLQKVIDDYSNVERVG